MGSQLLMVNRKKDNTHLTCRCHVYKSNPWNKRLVTSKGIERTRWDRESSSEREVQERVKRFTMLCKYWVNVHRGDAVDLGLQTNDTWCIISGFTVDSRAADVHRR